MGVCMPCWEHGSVWFQFGQQRDSQEAEARGLSAYGWFEQFWLEDSHGGLKLPLRGGCMACTATCRTGARTGTTRAITRSRR